MNKVVLIGRLTRDPELGTVGETQVCKFGLAVDRQYKSQSGEKQTDFFNIVVWRAQGVNCHKYLKKGSQCAISGRIEVRTYEDKKDGSKRTAVDIVADNVEFLGKPSGGGDDYGDINQDQPANKKVSIDTLEEIEDENLPF